MGNTFSYRVSVDSSRTNDVLYLDETVDGLKMTIDGDHYVSVILSEYAAKGLRLALARYARRQQA